MTFRLEELSELYHNLPKYETFLIYSITRHCEQYRDLVKLCKSLGKEPTEVIRAIARRMWSSKHQVAYPYEMIVVPRYPFTKATIIRWSELQSMNNREYVAKVKELCGKAGTLINAGFILRNFVLIDIDGVKNEELARVADVETRRGYHILFWIPEYEAVEISLGGQSSTKVVAGNERIKIEIMSGPLYLGTYPLQSWYMEIDNRVSIRRYKILSKRMEKAIATISLDTLRADIETVRETIRELLDILGLGSRPVEIKGVEKMDLPRIDVGPRVKSKFNALPYITLTTVTFREFVELARSGVIELPRCIKETLFGNPPKGYRWYHLRIFLAVVPRVVQMTREDLERFAEDFGARTNSTKGDIRKWIYDSKYFTSTAIVGDTEVVVASILGAPPEAWEAMKELGYCDDCPYRTICLPLPYSVRKKLIAESLAKFLSRVRSCSTTLG